MIYFKKNIIRLRGDREMEAFHNYMYLKYRVHILDRNFAINFCNKYQPKVVLITEGDKSYLNLIW